MPRSLQEQAVPTIRRKGQKPPLLGAARSLHHASKTLWKSSYEDAATVKRLVYPLFCLFFCYLLYGVGVLKTVATRGPVSGRDGLQRMSSGHSCRSSRALARRQSRVAMGGIYFLPCEALALITLMTSPLAMRIISRSGIFAGQLYRQHPHSIQS